MTNQHETINPISYHETDADPRDVITSLLVIIQIKKLGLGICIINSSVIRKQKISKTKWNSKMCPVQHFMRKILCTAKLFLLVIQPSSAVLKPSFLSYVYSFLS